MREKKFLGFILIVVIISELIIFLTAYSSSGQKKWIQVRNKSGDLVYEVKGNRLHQFDKYYFENNFGSLEKFNVKLIEKKVDFPVRGWLFASIALPVGLSFILLFIVKIISGLFPSIKNKLEISENEKIFSFPENTAKKDLFYNIYFTALFLFVGSFLIWALPVIFTSAAEKSLFIISEYPVIFTVIFTAFFILAVFTAYLRFKLRKYSIDKNYKLELVKLEYEEKKKFPGNNIENNYHIENKKENRLIKFNGDS